MAKRKKGLGKGLRPGRIPRRPRVLVVIGATETERQYFETVIKPLFKDSLAIEVRTNAVDPYALAVHAAALNERDETGFDLTLVVTDVDDYTAQRLRNAEKECASRGYMLVISNPCFEVWLIDHQRVCPGTCWTPADAQRLAIACGVVRRDKPKYIAEDKLKGRIADACANADKHDTQKRALARAALQNNAAYVPWTDMAGAVRRIQTLVQPSN